MSYQQRADALLSLVETDRMAKRNAILAQARDHAHAIVAEAHRLARERMRAAHADERHRADARVGAARAQLQTRLRLAHQAREHRWLEQAWQRLPVALQDRWCDATTRAVWVDRTIDDALHHLPPKAWRVEHAPGWPPSERETLAHRLSERGISVTFNPVDDLAAGLRIGVAGSTVDASAPGLLSDRDDIEAHLLASLESAS